MIVELSVISAGERLADAARLKDPVVARLRARVELHAFKPLPPPPTDRPARVTFVFSDGARHGAECLSARGGPDRPFSEDEIVGKIASIGGPVYPRLPDLATRLLRGERELLERSWNDVVGWLTEHAVV